MKRYCGRLAAGLLVISCLGGLVMAAEPTARPLADRLIIGVYQPPAGETLAAVKAAGFNLVHAAATKEGLDAVQAAGLMAWCSLGGSQDLSAQAEERKKALAATVEGVKGHPALLLWDGPDEPLYQIWGPEYFDKDLPAGSAERLAAAEACRAKSATQAQGLTAGREYVRGLDPAHPVWINHSPRHPVSLIGGLRGAADIHSFDLYPVPEGLGHSDLPNENLSSVGEHVERITAATHGAPVWAVLQGFAWGDIGIRDVRRTVEYPSFAQSRFMAYDALLHGATGVLYWGCHTLRADAGHWVALKALAAELAALAPALQAPLGPGPVVDVLSGWHTATLGVRTALHRVGDEVVLVVLNEERYPLEFRLRNLEPLAGRTLEELYTDRRPEVGKDGTLAMGLPGYGVSVLATSRRFEDRRPGREFDGRFVP